MKVQTARIRWPEMRHLDGRRCTILATVPVPSKPEVIGEYYVRMDNERSGGQWVKAEHVEVKE